MSRRLAAIDVGTNTVRLLAVAAHGERVEVLDEFGEVTRLGGALHATGRIAPGDADRTLACLRICLERARRAGVPSPDIVGTEVFRRAANGEAVAAEFGRALEHPVRILTGEEEAEASYLGAVGWGEDDPGPGPVVVIDVGGGSSEVILGHGVALLESRSLPVGALTLTEEFLRGDPPGEDAVRRAWTHLAPRLDPLRPLRASLDHLVATTSGPVRSTTAESPGGVRVLAVGGSACAVAAWVHDIVPYVAREVQGRWIQRATLERTVFDWSRMTMDERRLRGRMSEGRARVLPGGALILLALLESLDRPGCHASTFGLRHGLVLQRLLAA